MKVLVEGRKHRFSWFGEAGPNTLDVRCFLLWEIKEMINGSSVLWLQQQVLRIPVSMKTISPLPLPALCSY